MTLSATRPVEVVSRAADMRSLVRRAQAAGERVGLVPTMGALHEGHLTLVDAARKQCDRVVASIFVNPTQFRPGEDYEKYPRPLEQDLDLLAGRGCHWAFVPEAREMYPPGFSSFVDVGHVSEPWEGAARPGHFRGVATVVLKLLEIMPADHAYFGRKDYQQTLVVQRLAADFHLPTAIEICPTVREPDGLALSSRNAYLSGRQRGQAAALNRALAQAARLCDAGERSAAAIRSAMLAVIAQAGEGALDVEYIAVVREGTVDPVEQIDGPTTVAIAARVGQTRLIDNARIR